MTYRILLEYRPTICFVSLLVDRPVYLGVTMIPWNLTLPLILVASSPSVQTPATPVTPTQVTPPAKCPGGTCVSSEDLKVFVELLKDAQCRNETAPTLTADPVTIVVDKEGRIFGSGDAPKPYQYHLSWCNYKLDATSQIKLVAAQEVPATKGFRFRPKAYVGYLPVAAITAKDYRSGLDGGVLLEPVFLSWANLNAAIGVRSVGLGVGVDLFKNMDLYAGYAVTWEDWRSQFSIGVGFALW